MGLNEVTSQGKLQPFQVRPCWQERKLLPSALRASTSVCSEDGTSLSSLPTQRVWGELRAHGTGSLPIGGGEALRAWQSPYVKGSQTPAHFLFYFLLHISVAVGSGIPSQLITWALAALAHELFCLALFSLQMCFKLTFPSTALLGSGRKGRAVATLI